MLVHRLVTVLAVALATLCLGRGAAFAQGGADLSLSPKRIVFGAADRAATLYIFNRGTEAATFGLALSDQVMTPDGRIRPAAELSGVPEAADALARLKSAEALVSFSPRRVTLQPGASQTIRLRVLRPADLPAGEYRSHLTISAVPPEDLGLTAENAAKPDQGELSVKIVTLFSLAIPVIVRQGPAQVAAAIDKVELQWREAPDTDPAKRAALLSMDMVRSGESSLFGDIEVRALKGGKPGDVIGGLRGLGVYAEIDRRRIAVPLGASAKSGDSVQIIFKDDDTRPGTVLATAIYTIP